MTPDIRARLIAVYRDELRSCAEEFGGPAREWPARYGL
jgi:hypothetical protein